MYKYQNVSEQDQTITTNGNITPRIVKSGETCLSTVVIENPNFKYLGEEDAASVKGTVDQPQANAVLGNQTNKENE